MLYPNASDGAHILQIAAVTMVFVGINHTIQGSLFGLGKMYTPALALLIGCVIKIGLNLVLITNPNINIYGAVISSFICQFVVFMIVYITMKRNIKVKFEPVKHIIKPLLAGLIMGAVIFFINYLFNGVIRNSILTIINIMIGAVVYLISVFALKILSKDEILMLPKGEKIYNLLVKLKFYK